jgi:hypothetical protein
MAVANALSTSPQVCHGHSFRTWNCRRCTVTRMITSVFQSLSCIQILFSGMCK